VTFKVANVIPVWIFAIVGSVLVGVLSPDDEYFTWLQIVLAGATLATFCIHVFASSKAGLVNSMMASVGGAAVILAIATGVLALLSA
jgi:hypothetical protein